jgi:hypothetical protein
MFDVFDIGGLAMSPICKFFRHFIWICQYFHRLYHGSSSGDNSSNATILPNKYRYIIF